MAKAFEYVRKLIALRPENTTPTVVLERTLDKAPRIKGVLLVIHWDDDTYDTDWSAMKTSELAMASIVLGEQARRCVVRGD